jgi:hypothetical protein
MVFVLEVKHNFEKTLNDLKQFQVCRKMHSMECPLECWYYFCFSMRGSTAVIVFLCRNHTEKLFHCDLSWSSSLSTKELQLIRFDSTTSLDFAHKLFGITFAIGIRNRPQNRGEKPVSMHHGDVVNFVDVSTIDVNNRFAEFISSQGVHFVYDVHALLLRICVCYSRILAQSSCVRETLILDNNNAIPAHHHDGNPIVIPGAFL